jgi:hypothetical protein
MFSIQCYEAGLIGNFDFLLYVLNDPARSSLRRAIAAKALEGAIDGHRLDVAELLIQRGFSIDTITTSGRSPLMMAATYGNLELLNRLAELCADVHAVNRGNWTALHYAALSARGALTIGRLIELGAIVDAQNEDGDTPLIIAAGHKRLEAVEVLLKRKAKVDVWSHSGRSALRAALESRDLDVIAALLEHGADLLEADSNGKTTVEWAKEHGLSDLL